MSGINGVSFNTVMSNTNSLKKGNTANYAASFQGNTENTEEPKKKKSHKLLKALVLAGVAVAGYFLFKKHGTVIKDKLKNLFDSLKNKTKEVSQTADPVVKPEGKPTITSTEADVKVPTKSKKKSKQLPEDAVPPRRRVISDSADLKPGQKTKGRGVNYSHKERRNKKAIIKETLEKEQV